MMLMLNEIIKHLDGSDALYDFVDAVVKVRLKMTRDMYIIELNRLFSMDELTKPQKQDYKQLLGDVVAIDRVLEFYGWTEDDDVHD
jgi:hypothetical protein